VAIDAEHGTFVVKLIWSDELHNIFGTGQVAMG
jgi:hypothetical protein